MLKNRTFHFLFFFLALGLGSEWLLWQVERNDLFIAVMSPVLALSHLIQTNVNMSMQLSPEQNELIFVLPLTLAYFGLAGYWTRQICKESGFLKYFLLMAFTGFLAILHWQAFEHVQSILYSNSIPT